MSKRRRQHNAELRFRVVLAVAREVNTVSELASQQEMTPY